MSPTRRAPMDPRLPDWDRDREMAAADPPDELRRDPPEVDRSGMVIVYVAAGILVALILITLATRPRDSEVHMTPAPAGGGSSATSLSLGVPHDPALAPAAAIGDDRAVGAPVAGGLTAVDRSPYPSSVQPAGGGVLDAPATSVRGVATWYDAPSSRDAAAGPGLRKALGSHWRGTTVRVCAGDRCLTTRLTDWCLCSRGDRVIDLDDRAFRQLAPLSAGVVRVTITAAAASERRTPTAPPTDVAP